MSKVTVIGKDRVMGRVARIKSATEIAQRKLATDAGLAVQAALREEAPGHLGAKISRRSSVRNNKITVRFKAPWFTHFVTKGTKPHDIWAGFYTGKSDKRFLFFEGSGVAHVQHPGAKANHFVQRAYDTSIAPIRALIVAAGRAILAA